MAASWGGGAEGTCPQIPKVSKIVEEKDIKFLGMPRT